MSVDTDLDLDLPAKVECGYPFLDHMGVAVVCDKGRGHDAEVFPRRVRDHSALTCFGRVRVTCPPGGQN